MKKSILLVAVLAFALSFGVTAAVADTVVPGAYVQTDQSVMGVGQTIMQMGAKDRALTNALNAASRAGWARNTSMAGSYNMDVQFGSSQSEQSWKAVMTPDESPVPGLVAGDCSGDNTGARGELYRKQMGQDRSGYAKELVISNAQCGAYHPTLK